MSNKSSWDNFKKAKSTPDLTANLKDMEEGEFSLEQRLVTMRELNEEILTTSGPDGHAEHLRAMREIEDKIVTYNTAIGILQKRIEEATSLEEGERRDAECTAGIKVWADDTKAAVDVRNKFFKAMRDGYRAMQEFRTLESKIKGHQRSLNSWATERGCVPLDPFREHISKVGANHLPNSKGFHSSQQIMDDELLVPALEYAGKQVDEYVKSGWKI